MLRLAKISANKYKYALRSSTKIKHVFSENQLDVNIEDNTGIQESPDTNNVNTPTNTLLNIINQQKEKETRIDIWKNSIFKSLPNLQSNNIGNVGEIFLGRICETQQIESEIDGTKTKMVGGGAGDGTINGKTVEIKTAHRGGSNMSFQHELGEYPWHADYMAFIDVDPICVYMTIYGHIHSKMCILDVWTCILDVWTCILGVWTCIWVSGLVFGCLDLYFRCLDLYFRCLDLYLDVWT